MSLMVFKVESQCFYQKNYRLGLWVEKYLCKKTVLLFDCVGVWSPLGVKFSYKRPLSNTGVLPLSPRDIFG